MRLWVVVTWLFVCGATALAGGEQPLSRVAIERTILAVDDSVHVKASPLVLGLKGENSGWVEVEFFHPNPSKDDWIGVFSPANFSNSSVSHFCLQAEADGSNEFNDFQPGSLNTTNQIIRDLENIDMVVHIGDICYANGYLSQWDQFTSQIEPIASTVPYMIGSGNHERDWPGTGSFYGNRDSGGECGVPAQTVFYTPAENRAKFWYATDYGMFRFCIANTEEDWRPGTEQYKFIEQCLSSVDRQKQPWLIFLAHRVLGYSSCTYYETEGTFEEPMGREALQELWQKYKSQCVVDASDYYSGPFKATTHVVVGGAGASISDSEFTHFKYPVESLQGLRLRVRQLTAFNHSSLLLSTRRAATAMFTIISRLSRDYRDVLACSIDNCPRTTLAT
ncbi:hypothetical protein ACQ4PT_045332 [Festuca glaucescens]